MSQWAAWEHELDRDFVLLLLGRHGPDQFDAMEIDDESFAVSSGVTHDSGVFHGKVPVAQAFGDSEEPDVFEREDKPEVERDKPEVERDKPEVEREENPDKADTASGDKSADRLALVPDQLAKAEAEESDPGLLLILSPTALGASYARPRPEPPRPVAPTYTSGFVRSSSMFHDTSPIGYKVEVHNHYYGELRPRQWAEHDKAHLPITAFLPPPWAGPTPYALASYLQVVGNTVAVVYGVHLVVSAVRAVRLDVAHEVALRAAAARIEAEICRRRWVENQCLAPVPAVEQMCAQWAHCMLRDGRVWTTVAAHTLGLILNSLVEPMGLKVFFAGACVFACNVFFGYLRATLLR